LELLWLYGEQADGAEAIRVAERIKESSVAPEKLKREARALLIREDPQGRDFPIVFESADGRRIDGESLKGRKVLLHFWATWSPEAIGQFALLKQMLGSIGRDKLAVLSFNMDLLKSDFQKVIDEQSPDWPQQFDGEGYQNAFAKQVGVEELPACVLLDEQGRILVSGITTNLEAVLKKQFNID